MSDVNVLGVSVSDVCICVCVLGVNALGVSS